MMQKSGLSSALMALALLSTPAMAVDDNMTVWASYVYVRAGEYTPDFLPDTYNTLTSLGANQMQNAGTYLRSQYLQTGSASRISRVSASEPSQSQVYLLTLDSQPLVGSAQALMLGMWPPNSLSSNPSGGTLDIWNTFANGTYLENPLGGLNFPAITAASVNDQSSIIVSGDIACNGFSKYVSTGLEIDSLVQVDQESRATFGSIQDVLRGIVSSSYQSLSYAKSVYQYVNFANTHNRTVADLLSTEPTLLAELRHYADLQQTAYYGNMDAVSPYNRTPLIATKGSISTIAGASLAASIASQLSLTAFSDIVSAPLFITVGDYGPLLSLFALLNLDTRSPSFLGLPLPGSAVVFEVVSSPNAATTSTSLPSPSDLYVRFRIRNGTGLDPNITSSGGDLVSYPLFDLSNDTMPYTDFLTAMTTISISGTEDWCYQCASTAPFCAPYNISDTYITLPTTIPSTSTSHSLSPAVAGVIGAAITLLLIPLVTILLLFITGFRVSRTQEPIWISHSRKRELGGFKGGAKMASDPDLVGTVARTKDGAVVGASVEKRDEGEGGHARVGSWEMKGSPALSRDSDGTLVERMGRGNGEGRISADSGRLDPFADPVRGKSVV